MIIELGQDLLALMDQRLELLALIECGIAQDEQQTHLELRDIEHSIAELLARDYDRS